MENDTSFHLFNIYFIILFLNHYLTFIQQNGASPLYVACQEGLIDIVKFLLSNGADIHQTINVIRIINLK